MRERTRQTAERFGILDRVEDLERKLLELDHVTQVDFDLDGFYDNIHQVILVPKYDILVTSPDYYDIRSNMLKQIIDVASTFGLNPSGDRMEDYGEHMYIVRDCDDSWSRGIQKEANRVEPSLTDQIQSAQARTTQNCVSAPLFLFDEDRSGDRMGKPGDANNVYYADWHEFYAFGPDGKPHSEQCSLNFYSGYRLVPGGNDIGQADVIEAFRKKHPDRKVVVLRVERSQKDLADRMAHAKSEYEKNNTALFVLPAYNEKAKQSPLDR